MQNLFEKSLESLNVHGIEIKNRYVMGSMHTGLEDKFDYKRLAYYFEQRAKGGVGLIITGGYSPNLRGRLAPYSSQLSFGFQVKKHKLITRAVHKHDSKIIMQILHAGRYSHHPLNVAPSAIKSPINKFKPHAMYEWEIKKTIKDFVNSAVLAKKANYDGVEIMGSEGYLLNQFIAPRTNQRTDAWGGSFENRIKIVKEILTKTRKRVGDKFLIIFRLSALDLVSEGSSKEEVLKLAKIVEKAGASIINTGIGWHEARIPTIATSVPRANFLSYTKMIKSVVNIPCIAVNRFNNPFDVEEAIKTNSTDFVSMARPFLADPDFVNKVKENKASEINPCIACNQACLDHIFESKVASCLVNPKACFETEFETKKIEKKICVIGAGPAGLSAACELASSGANVDLIEKSSSLGGQFKLAMNIPGKEEFKGTIKYYETQIQKLNINLKLNKEISLENLKKENYDAIVFATGVRPRKINFKGSDLENVYQYDEVLARKLNPSKNVAIIGAGGIGFDMATYLCKSNSNNKFENFWGVDSSYENRGGLTKSEVNKDFENIYLLQRSAGKLGRKLGKTTGWIHRQTLKKYGVKMLDSIVYKEFTGTEFILEQNEKELRLKVDALVICAGQESVTDFYEKVKKEFGDEKVFIIGGAKNSSGIDAKRAIRDGLNLTTVLSR